VALAGVHSIQFVAGAGQANYLRGAHLPDTQEGDTVIHHYRFTDTHTIAAGGGCTYPDAADHRVVDCALPEIGDYYPQFDIALGDGKDRVSFAPGVGQDSHLDAGPGDDTITAGLTFESVEGGSGNDTIVGGGSISGGPGNDRISATDGTSDITGGRGNDIITGDRAENRIFGNSGNDEIRAGRGDDIVSGGPGNDVLYGNSGNDTIAGGPGTDKISGGPGKNKITP
jgi:serralysin